MSRAAEPLRSTAAVAATAPARIQCCRGWYSRGRRGRGKRRKSRRGWRAREGAGAGGAGARVVRACRVRLPPRWAAGAGEALGEFSVWGGRQGQDDGRRIDGGSVPIACHERFWLKKRLLLGWVLAIVKRWMLRCWLRLQSEQVSRGQRRREGAGEAREVRMTGLSVHLSAPLSTPRERDGSRSAWSEWPARDATLTTAAAHARQSRFAEEIGRAAG